MNEFVPHIWLALGLDLLVGDPRWFPHPVRFIGRLAQSLETPARRVLKQPRLAGIVVVCSVIDATGLLTWGIVSVTEAVSLLLRDLLVVGLLYTAFAVKDLARHSRAVLSALDQGDLGAARQCVARIVGRDTARLDEFAVTRATVESVAENTVDGVLAPLLFECLFTGSPLNCCRLSKAIMMRHSLKECQTQPPISWKNIFLAIPYPINTIPFL